MEDEVEEEGSSRMPHKGKRQRRAAAAGISDGIAAIAAEEHAQRYARGGAVDAAAGGSAQRPAQRDGRTAQPVPAEASGATIGMTSGVKGAETGGATSGATSGGTTSDTVRTARAARRAPPVHVAAAAARLPLRQLFRFLLLDYRALFPMQHPVTYVCVDAPSVAAVLGLAPGPTAALCGSPLAQDDSCYCRPELCFIQVPLTLL